MFENRKGRSQTEQKCSKSRCIYFKLHLYRTKLLNLKTPQKSASNDMHKTEMRQLTPQKRASNDMHKTEMRQLTPQKSASNDMHKTEMRQKSPPKNASKFTCVKIHCIKDH
jgi:hypothetical protein